MRSIQVRLLFFGVATAALVLACCNGNDGNGADPAGAVTLDLETLQAETPQGTVTAQEIDNAFVGEVTEDLFIGIALDEDGAGIYDDGEVLVYLCDSDEVAIWLTGDQSGDVTALESEESRVELEVENGVITGTLTLGSGDPEAFIAESASEDSGLYVATDSVDDGDVWVGWIIMHDGRQRGLLCYSAFGHTICLLSHEGPAGKTVSK